MEKEFKDIKEGQLGLWLILKGMGGILIKPLLDIALLIRKEIIDNIRNKKWKELLLAIIPILLIISFIIYSFYGIGKDLYKWWYSDRYERVLIDNYKQDIENFFKKYEERFLAHDCKFMREVGTDEAMFDKLGIRSYGEKYNCNAFYKIQEIKMLPIKIGEIRKVGNKIKVKGSLIRVEIIDGEPLIIAPIRFELWKTIDMDFWHFNLYGDSNSRWIESKFKKH